MKVVNDLVGLNLKIYQDDEFFKFSLESVLLPNFVNVNLRDKMILDLCTGNAPIPLVLSTKTKAKIYGVELQKEVFNLAVDSVKLNQKENQIEILNEDVKNLKNIFKGDTFDIITVNPPYFKVSDTSIRNENNTKSVARHEMELTLDELLKMASFLLKNNGYFYMVHRTERLIEILEKLKKYRLIPKKIQFIYKNEQSSSKLFLISASKNGNDGLKVLEPLFIHNEDGTYKKEIQEIFEGR